jgi:hypothetical protein
MPKFYIAMKENKLEQGPQSPYPIMERIELPFALRVLVCVT